MYALEELTNTGDVSKLFFLTEHITTQCIHNGLYLKLLHFVHEGPQAET